MTSLVYGLFATLSQLKFVDLYQQLFLVVRSGSVEEAKAAVVLESAALLCSRVQASGRLLCSVWSCFVLRVKVTKLAVGAQDALSH